MTTCWPSTTASVFWLPRVLAITSVFPEADGTGGRCSGRRMTSSPPSTVTFMRVPPSSIGGCAGVGYPGGPAGTGPPGVVVRRTTGAVRPASLPGGFAAGLVGCAGSARGHAAAPRVAGRLAVRPAPAGLDGGAAAQEQQDEAVAAEGVVAPVVLHPPGAQVADDGPEDAGQADDPAGRFGASGPDARPPRRAQSEFAAGGGQGVAVVQTGDDVRHDGGNLLRGLIVEGKKDAGASAADPEARRSEVVHPEGVAGMNRLNAEAADESRLPLIERPARGE